MSSVGGKRVEMAIKSVKPQISVLQLQIPGLSSHFPPTTLPPPLRPQKPLLLRSTP